MIQQKLTKTKTKMILITKTLVIFSPFYTPAEQEQPSQAHMQLPQHWWSDRSEAKFISTSLTSTHVRLVAVPSNSGIRKNTQTFTQLIAQDLVSTASSQAFVERLFSVCGMISHWILCACVVESEPWFICWHGHVMVWTQWTVLQLLYAQRWTCIVDTLSSIIQCVPGRPAIIFTKFKNYYLPTFPELRTITETK